MTLAMRAALYLRFNRYVCRYKYTIVSERVSRIGSAFTSGTYV